MIPVLNFDLFACQAEADETAGQEISRHIFRLFRDDHSLDSNPLMRRNNLSSSNPLL